MLAQQQSSNQRGFDVSHTRILKDSLANAAVIAVLSGIKTNVPTAHMTYYLQGGYETGEEDHFSPLEQYYLRHYGQFLDALAGGKIQPDNDWEEELLRMLSGKIKPDHDAARAWLKFAR